MKHSVPYVTDEGSGDHSVKNRRCMTISEAPSADISPVWRQIVLTTSGAIGQPWHYKLMQIRNELHK
ncbi:hypothetical protein FHR92_001248 [Fontibacillus solani]|uniref:Uncharacterized protein n=1 Tax=Fontibacillus solani TaxID=1572857 RepID=A0A7W3SRF2_9BACL|nr:hypothetical protein [Fontibacillus solani]MBA9084787.1 hypothetical protein [Fontibacillus solani]